MSVEIHDKLIALLADVEEFKTKEAAFKAEKARHLEQIAQSEEALRLCEEAINDVRENELRLKREMTELRDSLFARPEDEVIAVDEAHIPGDGEGAEQKNTAAKMAWDARAKHLKQVQ
jgi:hypothetical protein